MDGLEPPHTGGNLACPSSGPILAVGWRPTYLARIKGGRAMRTLLLALALASALMLGTFVTVDAARNPAGTGQPSAECGDPGATLEPSGFGSSGFAHAETVYAGSEGSASALHANSDHAVSQYDVACFQHTSNAH